MRKAIGVILVLGLVLGSSYGVAYVSDPTTWLDVGSVVIATAAVIVALCWLAVWLIES